MTDPAAPVITGAPARRGRVRTVVSVTLIVLAAALAVVGGVTLYLREEIVSSPAFADRTVDAVHQPAVSRVLARELTVQVVERSAPDLIAARPVVESVLEAVISSRPFGDALRLAAEHGHRLLFERRGGNAAFDLADAGTVVASALRTLAPKVAQRIPPRAEAVLLTLRRRSFAAGSLRFAQRVRLLGFLLPPLALAMFALAIAVARERRRALTRGAVAIAVTAGLAAIGLEAIRRYVIAHVYGSNELTNADVRGAIGALWGGYLGDLQTWTVAVTGFAVLLAAASASLLSPYSPWASLARLRSLARRPLSVPARGVAGAGALALGLFVVADPGLALRALAVLAGALLAYIGAGELLRAIAPAPGPSAAPAAAPARGRSHHRVALGVSLAAVLAVAGIVVALTTGAANVHARAALTCNGYAQLCARRVDQVVFAGTHNSMSAADSPGWLIANQDRAPGQQLDDGIRLFKISTHYAERDSAGDVHTDIVAAGSRLNRVSAKLDPAARKALQRLSRSLSSSASSLGQRDIWLCHTLCELGATRMVDFLGTIRRFLARNPNQVIILFDEDYVAERDLAGAFRRAGLFNRLATLVTGAPLPTLGTLIRTHRNVIVFAQRPPSAKFAWDADGFAWIQDTPLGARKPAQFSCRISRGRASNPLLMLNNWADVFPPRLSPNLPLVKRDFILARARQCVAQRGREPNLILTDYYNRGDVIGAVAALNGVSGVRPAKIIPLNPIP